MILIRQFAHILSTVPVSVFNILSNRSSLVTLVAVMLGYAQWYPFMIIPPDCRQMAATFVLIFTSSIDTTTRAKWSVMAINDMLKDK